MIPNVDDIISGDHVTVQEMYMYVSVRLASLRRTRTDAMNCPDVVELLALRRKVCAQGITNKRLRFDHNVITTCGSISQLFCPHQAFQREAVVCTGIVADLGLGIIGQQLSIGVFRNCWLQANHGDRRCRITGHAALVLVEYVCRSEFMVENGEGLDAKPSTL